MGIIPDHERMQRLSQEKSAAVRAELLSILKSRYFSGSKRCQDFLEFIVQHALDGNLEYLTERFLGAELFGRPIDYETGTDSIVRVRASDVRRRLAQFYSEGNGGGRVTIDLQSGSYVPEFHWSGPELPVPITEVLQYEHAPEAVVPPNEIVADHSKTIPHLEARHGWPWLLAAVIAIGLSLAFYAGWWVKDRSSDRAISPLTDAPSLASLWSGFTHSARGTDVVLSDASFQLLEDLGNRQFTLDDYLTRRYVSALHDQKTSPEMSSALNLIASKDFGNSSEFRLAERISGIDNHFRIYNSRDFSSTLAAQDNLILIGAAYTNPWQQLYAGRLNFLESAKTTSPVVVNNSPQPGEQKTYTPTRGIGYCVVAYLPSPNNNTKALLIEGSSSEATEAGGDFLLSEDKFSSFERRLPSGKLPFFEVLLKTSQVRGTPITETVEAYRIYSN